MALTLRVNGVDLTSLTLINSIHFSNKGLSGTVGVLRVSLLDTAGTASVLPEHVVTLSDGAVEIFEGKVRLRERGEAGAGANRKKTYDLTVEDTTSYLVDDVVDGNGKRSTTETDKQRIEWLLTTWGTKGVTGGTAVQAVKGTMPAGEQDFTGMTLYEAIAEVCKVSGGKFYVDFDLNLHHFATQTNPAAWNLSDSPNGSTTFGYTNLRLPDDTHDLINAVYVMGVDGLTPEWVTDATSIATYGRREATIRDGSLTTSDQLVAAGSAVIARQKLPRGPITLSTFTAGLRAGMTVQLTNATWGISAVTHPITSVEMGILPGTNSPVYDVTLDDAEVTLGDVIGAGVTTASEAYQTAQQAYAVGIDTTPPAVPTGLTLTSDTATDANGATIVRIIATLTHPGDADYFGSYIEVTRDNDGAESPSPVWTQPLVMLLGKENTKVAYEGVAGNVRYWGRARSVDFDNNKSAYTSVVSVVTARDTTAPAMPTTLTATAGFRGVAVKWVGGASDLMFYQLRYGPDGSNWPVVINTVTTVYWVPDLTPGSLYYFQVRAVDVSGNVVTSGSDPTAVDYASNPSAGYTASATATPTSVGSSDIAANSITAAHISAAGLSADSIKAGKLVLRATGTTAIEIRDANEVLLGQWEPTNGITIYGSNAADYGRFDDGYLRFYKAGVLTAEISPDGILADSIRLGSLPGGHNVISNSSFEMAAFVQGLSTVTFTDNTGTPGWKVGYRTTAPDNMDEGATLTMTTAAY